MRGRKSVYSRAREKARERQKERERRRNAERRGSFPLADEFRVLPFVTPFTRQSRQKSCPVPIIGCHPRAYLARPTPAARRGPTCGHTASGTIRRTEKPARPTRPSAHPRVMARSIVSSPVDPIKDYGETIVACSARTAAPLSPPLPPTMVLPLAIRDGFYVNGQTFDSAAYIETMELTPEYDVPYPMLLFLLSLFFRDFESRFYGFVGDD